MSTKFSGALAQKLLVYGVSAGAVTVSSSASATVLTFPVSETGNNLSFYFDPASGDLTTMSTGTTDETFSLTTTSYVEGSGPKAGKTVYTNTASASGMGSGIEVKPTSTSKVLENGQGATIGSGSTFSPSGTLFSNYDVFTAVYSPWTPGTQGYLGFEFSTGGQTDYGYADLTFNGPFAAEGSYTLNGLAYDDSGASIQTAPEPGTIAMLVAGAAGAAVWRRRRQRNLQ